MRFSAAATMIAATNPSVLAVSSSEDLSSPISTSKLQEERLAGNGGDKSNPIVRGYRTHWTMPKGSVKDTKSVLLANQKISAEIEDVGIKNKNSKDDISDKDGGDLGILSPSRQLRPREDNAEESIVVILNEGPNSDAFDSFTVFDRDKTQFYSICNSTVEEEYVCSRCDTDSEKETVTDFECQKISCYQIDSRCPNNEMMVCRYDTLSRTFDIEPSGNASEPYISEKCRKIEAKLSKTSRAMMPNETSSWNFTYCLRYNINSLLEDGKDENNTCEMEVDGIVCNSCLLETVDFSPANSTLDSTDIHQEFCVNFDCENTLLGYSGRFCNNAGLASRSLDYFVYRSLPCEGGCNLCGEAEDPAQMMMMTFRESDFQSPGLTNRTKYLNSLGLPETMNCFQTQWNALTRSALVCSDLQLAVESPCGCTPIGVPTRVPPNTTIATDSENSTATGDKEDESGAILAAKKGHFSVVIASLAAAWLIGFGPF